EAGYRMRLILPIAVALCAGCGPHTPQQNPEPLRSSLGIPSLSDFDDATRQSIELACMMQKTEGPVAYGSCLNKQIRALRSSPGIPSLSGLDDATRQSIELACMTQKTQGPVVYGECLRAQLRSIGIQPR